MVNGRQIMQSGLVLVIKTALHLPVSKIKLTAGATLQTGYVSSSAVRKRPAEFVMPTAKNSRHEISNFSSQRLHDLYLSSRQNYPSHPNAQTAGESGHVNATARGLVTLY